MSLVNPIFIKTLKSFGYTPLSQPNQPNGTNQKCHKLPTQLASTKQTANHTNQVWFEKLKNSLTGYTILNWSVLVGLVV